MSQPRRTITGKVVVVTGAASGIGRAIAHRFARVDARVAVLDVDGQGAGRTADEIVRAGGEALALRCDVTSEKECHDAVAAVIGRWNGIDVLVNNAGVTHLSKLAETDVSVYRRVFDINVFGALHCTQAALPSLQARRGAIVVMSSVAGFAPLYGRSGYSASKHALHGLFDTLRCELTASGVDVSIICPGFTDTNIEAHALGGGARNTVGPLATPEEVAEAIARAVERRRRFIVLSRVGKLSWFISRLSPAAYERLMTRRMA